ncbi:MAG: phage major capsid protein [Clostridia bacterium]
MKKLKLLKDFLHNGTSYKTGSILEVDEVTAKELIDNKTGEEFKDATPEQKDYSELIAKSIDKAMSDYAKAHPTVNFFVKDAPKEEAKFACLGEQLISVKDAALGRKIDPRLTAINKAAGLSEGVSADGGFLVQQDYVSELDKLAHETGRLPSKCQRIPVSAVSNGIIWNAVDESSRADGSRRGGITCYWIAEADQKTASKPKFARRTMNLEELIGVYYATDNLLMDTTALSAEVSSWFGEEFGFKLDDAILNGTGAGQPLGVFTSGALVSVAKESNQAADTVIAENIMKMYSRMVASSLPRAEWFINQEIYPQLFSLKVVIGTGGVPVFMPPAGLSVAPYGTLFGRPVNPIEQASALGDLGDISFLDLSQYKLIEKGGIQAASSIHVKFLTDETAFRFVMRVNGQPRWRAPLTPYKGSATLSPFVALAERA